MNTPLPPGVTPQDLARLHDAAADWFVRRQQTPWTDADEHALSAWLAQAPLHREIFEGLARNWHSGPQLKVLFPDDFPAPLRRPAPAPTSAPHRPFLAWLARPAPVLTLLVLALAAGGWYRWDHTPSYTLQATTTPGETREIALPDGSLIALNVGSRLQVHYYPRRREVVLDEGEAFFRVATDPGRPFTVDAGPSQVTVVGTAFNVRTAPPRLVVKVLEGRVQVTADRERPDTGALLLAAGSGISLDPNSGQHLDVPAEPDTVGDWRTGQVQFSQAPLDDVAAELGRYLGQPVTLADPALGRLRVSGLLATRSPERFLRALPEMLPVRVQPGGTREDGWQISAR